MRRILFLGAALLAMAGFGLTQYLIFYYAPLDARGPTALYFNQKIFYYHVPCAFMLFASVFTCGIASIYFVKRRKGQYDDIAIAAGELAVMFGAIVLVTGVLWGKAAWDKWWVWDARLTMSLILWLTMLGYVLVRKYGGPGSERLGAGLAIFAAVNVPLVYASVRIWRTLHPPTSTVPNLAGGMRVAFWLSVLLFGIMFVLMLRVRINVARGERRLAETRELALDAGLFE